MGEKMGKIKRFIILMGVVGAVSVSVIASSPAFGGAPRNDDKLSLRANEVSEAISKYFDEIDFNDPLIIRAREMTMFMDSFVNLYTMQAKDESERRKLLTEAGRVACEKASKGHPKVYGWMVDYFYTGYESYNIEEGMAMLEQHINNPNCLTLKKQQIAKRIEGMHKLIPGILAPNFIISDNEGKNFEFHKFKGNADYKLLLFWSADCSHCVELVNEIASLPSVARNDKGAAHHNDNESVIARHEVPKQSQLDIIAVGLDETESGTQKWETIIAGLSGWKHLHAKEGVNSLVANDYFILSTPVMFLIGNENNVIISIPNNFDELIKDLVSGSAKMEV